MIKSDKEFRLAQDAITAMEERVAELSQQPGANPTKGRLGALRVDLARLRAEVRQFDAVRRGDLSDFDTVDLFGRLLIAARLSRGMTQRDLAMRLGVHESQVSRDERHEYAGITLERWRQLCSVLQLDVQTHARLSETIARQAILDTEEKGGIDAAPRPVRLENASSPALPSAAGTTAFDSSRAHTFLKIERGGLVPPAWQSVADPVLSVATGATFLTQLYVRWAA